MLSMSIDDIRQRAELLVDRLAHAGIDASIVDGTSAVGGGSAPGALTADTVWWQSPHPPSGSKPRSAVRPHR